MTIHTVIDDIKFRSSFWLFKKLGFLSELNQENTIASSDYSKLQEIGFLKISSVLDMSEIKLIREHITTVIKKSDVFKDGHFERKPGNLKIKHMQNYCQFLSEFRYKKIFKYFSLMFYGWPKPPTVLYSITVDKDHSSEFVSGSCRVKSALSLTLIATKIISKS